MKEICQACCKEIEWNEKVIAVRYGTIRARVRHTNVSKDIVDYFHKSCSENVAIRGSEKNDR